MRFSLRTGRLVDDHDDRHAQLGPRPHLVSVLGQRIDREKAINYSWYQEIHDCTSWCYFYFQNRPAVDTWVCSDSWLYHNRFSSRHQPNAPLTLCKRFTTSRPLDGDSDDTWISARMIQKSHSINGYSLCWWLFMQSNGNWWWLVVVNGRRLMMTNGY